MAKWREDIEKALNNLGGQAHLSDIYCEIEKIREGKLSQKWHSVVRGEIERFSSDSKVYNGKLDFFYSVEGKGNGIWGLRNFKVTKETVDLTEDDISFVEGKEKLRKHIFKERNPRLVLEAKKNFKKENGKLYCEVCGFDFENKYGDIGIDFIEAHHIKPLSDMEEESETRVEDLVMLCSNCHKMIHRKRPWLSKNKLSELINKNN